MANQHKSLQNMTLVFDGAVAILTLSRPDAMNAMNSQFFADFQSVLSDLSAAESPARVLLITAEGKGFCAGADLKEQADKMPPDLGETIRNNYTPLILGLKKLPVPTIVAINGVAAGAGMSLVCACDIAIAAREAFFVQAFINIALVPDAGSTYFLPRLAGRARAAALMMLGERLASEQALDYGIISRVVDQADLMETAMTYARKLASQPTQALLSIRELLDASEQNSLIQQLEAEAVAQQKSGCSQDFIEGVMAFLQKRPAKFTGK